MFEMVLVEEGMCPGGNWGFLSVYITRIGF